MCGRFALSTLPREVAQEFGLFEPEQWRPRFNIAPTQDALVIRAGDDGSARLESMQWGLIPSWSKDGKGWINARCETAASKPAFRSAFAYRRCLAPASGFYEWQEIPGERTKRPHYIRPATSDGFCFAGVHEQWGDVRTFAILTTEAQGDMRSIHHRMPVILPRGAWRTWLDDATDVATAQSLCGAGLDGELTLCEVSTRVNKPANDDESLIVPVESFGGLW